MLDHQIPYRSFVMELPSEIVDYSAKYNYEKAKIKLAKVSLMPKIRITFSIPRGFMFIR